MKTNEQVKQEAIEKAWIDTGHYEGFVNDIDQDGYVPDKKHSFIGWEDRFDLYLEPELGYNGESIGVERWRPKALQNLETNNGWIRIEPDGSNLPNDYTKNYKTGKFNIDSLFDIDSTQWGVIFVEKRFKSGLITHYKPIEKEPLPIY